MRHRGRRETLAAYVTDLAVCGFFVVVLWSVFAMVDVWDKILMEVD